MPPIGYQFISSYDLNSCSEQRGEIENASSLLAMSSLCIGGKATEREFDREGSSTGSGESGRIPILYDKPGQDQDTPRCKFESASPSTRAKGVRNITCMPSSMVDLSQATILPSKQTTNPCRQQAPHTTINTPAHRIPLFGMESTIFPFRTAPATAIGTTSKDITNRVKALRFRRRAPSPSR